MAGDEDLAAMAASFDQAAAVYEKSRPEYPSDAVDWLLPARARTVLDLGAGTGKLTRALAARGLDVIAVDPSPRMLDELRDAVPEAIVREGTAEDIPLPGASVDAVLVAQAWHWVDEDLALPSVARVLKPGGTLGLVWNVRDERVPWVARLTEVMHSATGEVFVEKGEIKRGPFGEIEKASFEWTRVFDRDGLLDLLRSRSYYITASPDEQRRLIAGVGELLDTHPDLAGRDSWEMPYVTHAFRMRLPIDRR
jgi:ubiquinone/menaquinone biosynthesis C-methylase UbiE